MGFEPMRLAPDELESSTLTTRSPALAAYNKARSVSRNALVAPRIELGLQEIYVLSESCVLTIILCNLVVLQIAAPERMTLPRLELGHQDSKSCILTN